MLSNKAIRYLLGAIISYLIGTFGGASIAYFVSPWWALPFVILVTFFMVLFEVKAMTVDDRN